MKIQFSKMRSQVCEGYQVGTQFEALYEGVLVAPLDSRCTQVGFNLPFVQVCETAIFSLGSLFMLLAENVILNVCRCYPS